MNRRSTIVTLLFLILQFSAVISFDVDEFGSITVTEDTTYDSDLVIEGLNPVFTIADGVNLTINGYINIVHGSVVIGAGSFLVTNGGVNVTSIAPVTFTIGPNSQFQVQDFNIYGETFLEGEGTVSMLQSNTYIYGEAILHLYAPLVVGFETTIETDENALLSLGGAVNVESDTNIAANIIFETGTKISGAGQLIIDSCDMHDHEHICHFVGSQISSKRAASDDSPITFASTVVIDSNCLIDTSITLLSGSIFTSQQSLSLTPGATITVETGAQLIMDYAATLIAITTWNEPRDEPAVLTSTIDGDLTIRNAVSLKSQVGTSLAITGKLDTSAVTDQIFIEGIISVASIQLDGGAMVLQNTDTTVTALTARLSQRSSLWVDAVGSQCAHLVVSGRVNIRSNLVINALGPLDQTLSVVSFGSTIGKFRSLIVRETVSSTNGSINADGTPVVSTSVIYDSSYKLGVVSNTYVASTSNSVQNTHNHQRSMIDDSQSSKFNVSYETGFATSRSETSDSPSTDSLKIIATTLIYSAIVLVMFR